MFNPSKLSSVKKKVDKNGPRPYNSGNNDRNPDKNKGNPYKI